MNILINDKNVEIIIEYKKIKNSYIRVKNDLKIYVSVPFFVSDKYISNLINDNIKSIEKMYYLATKRSEKENKFYYLGKEYQVIITNGVKNTTIEDNYVYVKEEKDLNKFLEQEAKRIFPIRLRYIYDKINNEKIPFPTLKIRKMRRKWGYCNKSKKIVMLNKELIKYSIDDIDYVITHELCHFLYFDHSPSFWASVKKYKPDYKINKKNLKE